MIALTVTEWGEKRDKLAQTERPGQKAVVYSHTILYNKKKAPVSVLGKFILTEDRKWQRL